MFTNSDIWLKAGGEFLYLLSELSFLFIGISFLVALIQVFISPYKIKNWLNKPSKIYSSILGAMLGSVTPFCSCSTIPLLVGLINGQAPFSGIFSFLITSPILNPAILTLMSAFFGLKATMIYAASTFLFAVITGYFLDRLGFRKEIYEVSISGDKGGTGSDWSQFQGVLIDKWKSAIVSALRSSLGLFKRILPFLILGAFIGAFIHEVLPVDLIKEFSGKSSWWAIPAAALIGIPLYIRTETMIPLAAVLLSIGVAPGVLISMIIGGAGASIPEVALLSSIFKKKLIAVFLGSVFTIACITGYLFNIFLN